MGDIHRFRCRMIIVALLLCSGTSVSRGADESPFSIRSVEAWSGVFAGKETEFRFEVSSTLKAEVRASWSLAAESGVLARRETTFAVEPDKPGVLSARFELPDAREGIILPLDLTVAVESRGEHANLKKRLWLFPDDPFALEKEWLEELKIKLFDPAGETARRFTDAKIPFEPIRTIDQAAVLGEGVLVVGEGLSWVKQRALPGLVLDLASTGVGVLALSPTDGSLPLFGSDAENLPSLESMLIRRSDIISELDKRLDAVAWPPDGKLQASGLQISADRGRVVARAVEGTDGWPWFECHFAAPRGRLIVCGFPVVKQWDAGPTPRYLFARMLERLVDREKEPLDDDAERPACANP